MTAPQLELVTIGVWERLIFPPDLTLNGDHRLPFYCPLYSQSQRTVVMVVMGVTKLLVLVVAMSTEYITVLPRSSI